MWFKKKEPMPRRPEVCGTPMEEAIAKRDKCAVKQAQDYQYNQSLAIYEWDIRYGELSDIERADIQIKIGQLREFQKENGFGPWYQEDDVENKIRFRDE
jgi:hypothetical protein